MKPTKPANVATRPAWRDPFIGVTVVAAVVQVAVVWLPWLPLGIPDEWVWERIPYGPGEAATLFLNLFIAVPAAIVYIWFCRAGDRRFETGVSARRWPWLAGLVVVGFGWLWVVQESAPGDIYRLGRAPFVQYFPSFSGYFTEARGIDDLGAFLENYEARMAEGDVLHIGTHPPGLIVAHWTLLQVYQRSPALTRLTLATQPRSVRATGSLLLERPARDGNSGAVLAELWAASLLVQAGAAAAVIPLAVLVASTAGPTVAWRTAVLWPLVPALAVFLPKSDAILPLFGLSVLALWSGPNPPGAVRAALAGIAFWLGMLISLAMLPVAVVAGLLTCQAVWSRERGERVGRAITYGKATAIAAAAFAALTGLIWLACDLNLFNVWLWNFRNHATFYDVYPRSYGAWLLVSPLELALAIGLPVVVVVAASLRHVTLRTPALAAGGVILLLWISGKNTGEAARLWLFLMPWLLWLAAPALASRLSSSSDGSGTRWRAVLLAQLIASFLTAVRVSGFGFEEYLRSAA